MMWMSNPVAEITETANRVRCESGGSGALNRLIESIALTICWLNSSAVAFHGISPNFSVSFRKKIESSSTSTTSWTSGTTARGVRRFCNRTPTPVITAHSSALMNRNGPENTGVSTSDPSTVAPQAAREILA